MKRRLQIITIICFLGFLSVFSLLGIILPDKTFSDYENRVLQDFPSLSSKSLFTGKFMEQFAEYVQDQFPFRNGWISMKAASEIILSKKENNGIYITKDALIAEFSAADLQMPDKNTERVSRFAENTDKPVYLIVAPTIAGIYPHMLPQYNPDVDQSMLIDRISENLSEDVCFVDVRDDLEATKDQKIYFSTDHHWTARGAYSAYRALMRIKGVEVSPLEEYERIVLSEDFRGTSYSASGVFWYEGDELEAFVKAEYAGVRMMADGEQFDSMFVKENLEKKDQYTYFLDGNHALVTLDTNNGKEETLLVIKDSYAHIMMPYLTENYGKIIMIDLRYYRNSIQELIEQESIDEILFIYNIESFATDSNLVFLDY